jgi:hypothetical protein
MGMQANGLRILHLIERLSLGGAGRSLIAAAEQSQARHRILSLRPTNPDAVERARRSRISLAQPGMIEEEIANCDVLHVHFWNTPELYDALTRQLPPARFLMTAHVLGSTEPHVLPGELYQLFDRVIATTPVTPGDYMIPPAADFTRIACEAKRGDGKFTVGFIGSLDFCKLHPDYIRMHLSIEGDYRVLVAGDGPDASKLRRQAEAAGIADRFEWFGYVENISDVLNKCDVFGYPLRPSNFATAELVLHEAMYAGLPCVLLADGGASHTIAHNKTGFVVANIAEYVERVHELRESSVLRERVGRAAAVHARAHLGAAKIAPLIDAVYAEMVDHKAVPRRLLRVASGHAAWLRSLGRGGDRFRRSLAGDEIADDEIMAASPSVASADAGGVLHYRRYYPGDAVLRYWAGLVLLGQGRFALAAGEFRAAQNAGFDMMRCERKLRETIVRSRRFTNKPLDPPAYILE